MATLITGDALIELRKLPAGSVRCCVTSPPYFGLRDYGTGTWEGGDPSCSHRRRSVRPDHSGRTLTGRGVQASSVSSATPYKDACPECGAVRVDQQLGLEATPDAYVERLVEVFREVRRVLTDDGTLWLNLGDSYAANRSYQVTDSKHIDVGNTKASRVPDGLKPKDLVGIPWLVAFALRADGWTLRSEIVWNKPNPMPESVTDRPTKSHEQIFLFSKAKWIGPERGRFAHISDEDARWLALLIDAEGCIVVKRCKHEGRGDTFAPQVSIGNTSEALMREVVRIVGHGSLLERPGKNCRMLYWQLANVVARDFLCRIYPFLIVKRRQARIGIHVDSLTYYRGGQKAERKERNSAELRVLESLWARGKECNHFGQPNLDDVPEPKFGRWDSRPYYYDAAAIAEPLESNRETWGRHSKKDPGAQAVSSRPMFRNGRDGTEWGNDITRNARSVWTISTQPYPEAHFATFPEELARRCILAGSAPGDTILDPFGGSGTVAQVATGNGRHAIYIDLNPAYAALARQRIGPMLCEEPA